MNQVLETEIDIKEPNQPITEREIHGEVEFKQVTFSY